MVDGADADPDAADFEVGETADVDSVDSDAWLVDVVVIPIDMDVDSLGADVD